LHQVACNPGRHPKTFTDCRFHFGPQADMYSPHRTQIGRKGSGANMETKARGVRGPLARHHHHLPLDQLEPLVLVEDADFPPCD
jgi:hypothetical protein